MKCHRCNNIVFEDAYLYDPTCKCGNNDKSMIVCRNCFTDLYKVNVFSTTSKVEEYICKTCIRDKKIDKVLK